MAEAVTSSIISIPDGLSEKRPLVRLQAELFRHRRLVAVVEPRHQSQGSSSQINVLRDQASVDKVIRFLNFRAIQARFR